MENVRPDKGVHKRLGSSVWQLRIFVPADVRGHFGGKAVLGAQSLGTRDLAEANARARKRVAEFEERFTALRHGATPFAGINSDKSALTARLIEALAERRRSDVVDADFARSADIFARAKADPTAFWRGDLIPIPDVPRSPYHGWSAWDALCADETTQLENGVAFVLNGHRENRLASLRQALRIGDVDGTATVADGLLPAYNYTDVQRLALIKRLMESEIGALVSILDNEATHFPGVFDDAAPVLKDDKENPLLSTAARSWIAEKSTLELTQRRIEDCEAAIALFIEVVGDKPIGNYTKGNVREFKDILRKLPATEASGGRPGASASARLSRRLKSSAWSR